MKQFWISLSRGKQIAASVLFAHFFLLLMLMIHHFATPRLGPKKAIAIRTVSPVVQQFSAPAAQKPAVQKPVPSKPASSNVKKKSAPEPKKIGHGHAQGQGREEVLFEELNKSLEALSSLSASPSSSSSLPIPKSIEKKSSATLEQSSDVSYAESLICYLQNFLELPELGEVKALLEVGPNGELQRCEILEAKSHRNAEFLKKRLPELPFPCFNDADAKTFTVVFRNVENR